MYRITHLFTKMHLALPAANKVTLLPQVLPFLNLRLSDCAPFTMSIKACDDLTN